MSGGVDSSVAAALLKDSGYDVVGMTMRLFPQCGSATGANPIEDAQRVAAHLGIPHHVAEFTQLFQHQVLDYFLDEYARGRTPNPCIRCNRRIKFGALFDKARELGGEALATGHYVRVIDHDGRRAVCRAKYRAKDQSYMLSGLSQEQLARVLFPLGNQTKDDTRAMARSLGLDIAEKSDSQDVCFLGGGDYRSYVAGQGQTGPPGPIVSTAGEVLGTHTGLTNYTIGQRKGLGVAAPRPYYVVRLDAENNTVVVGHEDETFAKGLTTSDIVWAGIAPQTGPLECCIQIRYRHEAVPCTVETGTDRFSARFHEPQRAVTPGQWAVLYRDDMVLAAGTIDTFE